MDESVMGNFFNITNENLTNKEISHCEWHIRMHALSSVKFFFFGLGEAWGSLTLLGSLGLGRAQILPLKKLISLCLV